MRGYLLVSMVTICKEIVSMESVAMVTVQILGGGALVSSCTASVYRSGVCGEGGRFLGSALCL